MTYIEPTQKRKRCAIYTRKSSEEGLDQEFNSLDAQREAGKNKILSQRHEGWELINDHYDDGGISGGTMERPALQRLLEDIKAGKIDIVLVYKIDRLSRSMLDFLGMIKFFDEHNVSFVSVTQDLNTDTAMGRLVLNVLQSFAQFEREIASERIKDKIALSKQKGMWMGGAIPLGYDAIDGKLHVNNNEAKIVQFIFESFAETASVTKVVKTTKTIGYKSKARKSRRGTYYPAKYFTKSSLYQILRNQLYIGKIEHKEKGEVYEGLHKAIIDIELWNRVDGLLRSDVKSRPRQTSADRPYLLKGLLKDPDGYSITPTFTKKKDGRIYRYYVSTQATKKSYNESPLKTISAPFLEDTILDHAKKILTNAEWIKRVMDSTSEAQIPLTKIRSTLKNIDMLWEELFPAEQARIIQLIIKDIVVHPQKLIVTFYPPGMLSVLHQFMPDLRFKGDIDDPMILEIPVNLKHNRAQKVIIAPDGQHIISNDEPHYESPLVKAIVRAHHWQGMIDRGEAHSAQDIAKQEKLSTGYTEKVIRLTELAPDITSAIMDGRQPETLQINTLIKGRALPHDWNEQRKILGFQ